MLQIISVPLGWIMSRIYDLVGNYGMMQAKVENGKLVVTKQIVADIDKEFFLRETNRLREKYGYTEYAGEPIEWHPSGMVTFALLGTKAKKEDKLVFDPDRAKRCVLHRSNIFSLVLELFCAKTYRKRCYR
mgnify:CR=1 FL=1